MIGIIGSLCDNRESASGQAVRTTILYNELRNRYGEKNVYRVDTHGFKSHPVRVFFHTISCIIHCKNIIVMVHENGRKVFFPMLSLATRIVRRNVYHNVIGGSFAEYLEENPRLIKYVRRFRVNWVQMQSQIIKLNQMGVDNTELLPNTKRIKILDESEIKPYTEPVFRFCMCSRISIEKGTELAINAIETVNKKYNRVVASLDIFGKPDADYEETFKERLGRVPTFIRYCGFIPNEKTVERLKGYYMLLFPSTYRGEGFPGTVWDAFAAGVPMIATNWRYNAEVIQDGVTGLIYNYNNTKGLIDMIEYAMEHRQDINDMRIKCIQTISEYSPEKVFPIIFKYLDDEMEK